MANNKGAGGIMRGTSVRVALLFERAEGARASPARRSPLATAVASSVHGATPEDGGRLL